MPKRHECGKPLFSSFAICPDCLDALRDAARDTSVSQIAESIADSCNETFLNGHTVCIVLARSGRTALIMRMVRDENAAAFVVPFEHIPGETSWWQGHYFDNLGCAWEYYQNQIKGDVPE